MSFLPQENIIPITQTQAPDEMTNAQVGQSEGKRIVRLKGPLSEVLRRALNIMYAKDSEYQENVSLESETDPSSEFAEIVFFAFTHQITVQLIEDFTVLAKAARDEGKPLTLITMVDKTEPGDDNLVSVLNSVANAHDVSIYKRPEDFFK